MEIGKIMACDWWSRQVLKNAIRLIMACDWWSKQVLDACLFEPGQWQADYFKQVGPMVQTDGISASTLSHMICSCGRFEYEHCPDSDRNHIATYSLIFTLTSHLCFTTEVGPDSNRLLESLNQLHHTARYITAHAYIGIFKCSHTVIT